MKIIHSSNRRTGPTITTTTTARPSLPSAQVLQQAKLFISQNNFEVARSLLEQLLATTPTLAEGRILLATVYRNLKLYSQALSQIDQVQVDQPRLSNALAEKAEILVEIGAIDDALALYLELSSKIPIVPELLDRWCNLMLEHGRNDELARQLRQFSVSHPNQAHYALALGTVLRINGSMVEAAVALSRANELMPDNPVILYDLSLVQSFLGQTDSAQALLERSLQLKPDNVTALHRFGMDHKYRYGDTAFRRLNVAAARISELPLSDQVGLLNAQGKAYEDVGEYDVAFACYGVSGRLKRRQEPYDDSQSAKRHGVMKAVFTAERLSNPQEAGCDSDVPLFVLGMPRSGTTLLEQVLSSHPNIFGAGELKYLRQTLQGIQVERYKLNLGDANAFFDHALTVSFQERGQRYVNELRKLAPPGARRIVDKMPGNYMQVGAIHLILPNAKIIHSRRHPVETCLSCYRRLFGEGHLWSYDLRDLGRRYRLYQDIVDYWDQVLPGKMLAVRYEDMVDDLEGQAQRIIAFTGLEWNDACLRFHETERVVKTNPSAVRKPIYTSSMNRWRAYEPYIKPLLEELAPLITRYEEELANRPLKGDVISAQKARKRKKGD